MDDKEKLEETFQFIKLIWALFMAALYLTCFIDEYRFPGERSEPLKGEEGIWLIQNVLFFGLMGLGFLADMVHIKIDKSKAFLFLAMSLVLGGLASTIGALQFRIIKKLMIAFGVDV